jgi:DNA-binding MarR family transcriptional regulator
MKSHGDNFDRVLGRLMGLAGRVMISQLDRNLAEAGHDLSAEQAILLNHIVYQEGASQQIFTDFLFRDKTYVTRLIDALEEKKLVTRVQNRADRRQNSIYLTSKGKKTVEATLKLALMTQRQAVKGIDPKKVDTCKDVLTQVYRNLIEK